MKLETSGETLSIELAGYQPTATNRYLAIGFNEEEGMVGHTSSRIVLINYF